MCLSPKEGCSAIKKKTLPLATTRWTSRALCYVEEVRLYDLTYTWITKPQKPSSEMQRTDRWSPEGTGWRVKTYKVPVIKQVSHRDVIYSIINIRVTS